MPSVRDAGRTVLIARPKLVFDVARIYYQRPAIRNLLHLYVNVAAMVFFAGEIEDMDLAGIVQPILTGILGSAAGAIPGFQVASIMLVSSVISGSSNAFLTLRVGAITKQYCRSIVVPSKRTIHRRATVEATKMLGSIVTEGTKKVYDAIWTSSKRRLETAIDDVGAYAKKIWMKLGGQGPRSAAPYKLPVFPEPALFIEQEPLKVDPLSITMPGEVILPLWTAVSSSTTCSSA